MVAQVPTTDIEVFKGLAIPKPIQNAAIGIAIGAVLGFILAGPAGAVIGAKAGGAGGASA